MHAVDPGGGFGVRGEFYPEDFLIPWLARTLARAGLAGLQPAGVICEIVNDDGTMARVPDLIPFCNTHGLVMVTVADLARYRLESEFDGSTWAINGCSLWV